RGLGGHEKCHISARFVTGKAVQFTQEQEPGGQGILFRCPFKVGSPRDKGRRVAGWNGWARANTRRECSCTENKKRRPNCPEVDRLAIPHRITFSSNPR